MGSKGALRKTSELTEVGYKTVQRIVSKGELDTSLKIVNSKKKYHLIDNFTSDCIIRKIYECYKNNVVPSVSMLLQIFHEAEIDFPYKKTHLYSYLKHIGFSFATLDARRIILESPRLVKLREEYIRKIRVIRLQNKKIIALDETWYDTHDVKKKGFCDKSGQCVLNAPSSRGKRIIILHAISDDGWIDGGLLLSAKNIKDSSADYHEDMSANLFEEWFKTQLLPNIPPESVIIMDNASYHSRQLEKIPSTSTKKSDIISYLRSKNIPFPQKCNKDVLLNIVKTNSFQKSFVIEKMAEDCGHQVLRLPPYYCILNPIELIWSNLKRRIRQHNTCPTQGSGVIELIKQEVLKTDNQIFRNCFRHTVDVENSFLMPEHVERFVINTNSEDSSSTDSE